MILVRNLHLHIEETDQSDILQLRLRKKLGLGADVPFTFRIVKESLDARQKNNIHFIYQILCTVENEARVRKSMDKDCVEYLEEALPEAAYGTSAMTCRPVVVGFGPSGIFCALTLAQAGFKPIVLEMGMDVVQRTRAVETFWAGGPLDPSCNVQFGEGGAGTFSDGKLTTRIKDQRVDAVINAFVEAGAPEEIRYLQKPHVGTDLLKGVVKKLREKVIALGGEIRFQAKLTDITIKSGKVAAITVNDQAMAVETLVLCLGHSSRDTYTMLFSRGVAMEGKAFAVGLRVEHDQHSLDAIQYGRYSDHPKLKASEYSLAHKLPDGRGVYSFCMCPGGRVVNASSEAGHLCVNGMSYHARNRTNANSAILVSVTPADFGTSPLDGILFQRRFEKAAFQMGGGDYRAPVQAAADFLQGKVSPDLRGIQPEIKPGFTIAPLHELYPPFITGAISQGMGEFGRRIKGFDQTGVFTGAETRSSAPLRILRNTDGESINVRGLFPAGEGAGYAGGIMSAAVDGIKTAEKIKSRFKQPGDSL